MASIIKGLRILRGYTQEDVANSIGMTSRTYCKKESNPDLFTIGELRRLSLLFDVSEEILFKRELIVIVS